MRIGALYKQSGKADWAKSRERKRKADRSQRDNCLREKERNAEKNIRENGAVAEPSCAERSWASAEGQRILEGRSCYSWELVEDGSVGAGAGLPRRVCKAANLRRTEAPKKP